MINWENINTVLLDMDGTLLDLHFDNHFWHQVVPEQYAIKHDLDKTEAYHRLVPMFEQHKGQLNWYCLDFWSQSLQLDIVSLKEQSRHLIRERPHAVAFLQWLQRRELHPVLVTNAHRGSLDLKLADTDIQPYLKAIISAHDVGHPKEAQPFWEACHLHLHWNPATTLLIDDNEAVLKSARRYGIRHLLSIAQPDSQISEQRHSEFAQLHCYTDIMEDASDGTLQS